MSGDLREDSSSGRLQRAAMKAISPLPVDCTAWDRDNPAEKWSSGKLTRITGSQAPAQGAFTEAGSLELEIALEIEAGVNPAQAFGIATRFVANVLGCDPDLRLIYNLTRSGVDESRVLIVLTPSRPGPDAEARLEKIAEVIRKAASEAGGIDLNGVRILRAA